MKKISIIISVLFLLLLSGCTQNKVSENYPNKDLVDGLLRTNQYFLENSKKLKGDVVISAVGKGTYQGSALEIALCSTNEKNSINVKGNVSSQTVLFIIDSLAKTKLNGSGFKIDLTSASQEYKLGENGNASSQFLTLNEDVLTPFFKTNALYFETDENKVAFAKELSQKITATTTEVLPGGDVNSIYTLELQGDSLSYILPFTVPSHSQKMQLRIIQNQKTKALSRFDVIVYKDRIANQEQTLAFDIDVSLQFNIKMEDAVNG